jgi:hypothetical protein
LPFWADESVHARLGRAVAELRNLDAPLLDVQRRAGRLM